ncbi:hypothetical protein [Chryseobacterium sp. M5A1_1a]
MDPKELRIGNLVNYVLFPNVIDASVQVVVSKASETHVTIKEWEKDNPIDPEDFARFTKFHIEINELMKAAKERMN